MRKVCSQMSSLAHHPVKGNCSGPLGTPRTHLSHVYAQYTCLYQWMSAFSGGHMLSEGMCSWQDQTCKYMLPDLSTSPYTVLLGRHHLLKSVAMATAVYFA